MEEQVKVMRAVLLSHIIILAVAREGLGEPGATSILVEDQDQVSRVKRNSETGLVGEPVGGGGMQMLGEEERSVVGCGEVVLACPTTTMIVVSHPVVEMVLVNFGESWWRWWRWRRDVLTGTTATAIKCDQVQMHSSQDRK